MVRCICVIKDGLLGALHAINLVLESIGEAHRLDLDMRVIIYKLAIRSWVENWVEARWQVFDGGQALILGGRLSLVLYMGCIWMIYSFDTR